MTMRRRSNAADIMPRRRGLHRPPHSSCLYFAGSDNRVVGAHIAAYAAKLTVTIEMWIKSNEFTALKSLLHKGDHTVSQQQCQWGVCIDYNGSTTLQGYFFNQYYTSGWRSTPSRYPCILRERGEWIHLAVASDNASPYYTWVFVNGQLVDIITKPTYIQASNYPVYLGVRKSTAYDWDYIGCMSDVRVWDGFLNEAAIRQRMYTALAGNEPNLLLYWPLNEGAGSTVYDKTSNANNGTITGATWVAT